MPSLGRTGVFLGSIRGQGWCCSLTKVKQWLPLFGRSFHDMMADQCFTHAAAIAYYMVVSIFPLMLLLIGVLGFFLEAETTQRQALALARRYLPHDSLLLIRDNIHSIVEARGSLSILSLAGLLWSASLLFDGINQAINAAWGTHAQVRFVSSKIKSLLIVSVMILIGLSTTVLSAQASLVERFQSYFVRNRWAEWIWQTGSPLASRFLSWALTVAAFILTYRFLPLTAVRLKDVWVAAFMGATIWEASKQAFVWYVTRFADYGQVYGSISAVLVLMLWAYLSALILMWGAEFAAEYANWRSRCKVA